MKRFKKMMALVIVAVMTMMYVVPMSFAAAGDYQITVENTNDAMSINGKQYKAYKVFDLTLGAEDTSTSPSTWGAYAYSINSSDWAWDTLVDGATIDSPSGVITTTYGIVLTPSAADPTTYVVDGSTMDESNARDLADALESVLPATADGTGTGGTNEKAVIDLSDGGYYAVYGVVVPTDPSEDPVEEIVAAVGLTTTDKKVTVQPKASVPTLDKKITSVTEATSSSTQTVSDAVLDADGKAAVAKVGSTVSFEIDSVVPDMTGYTSYTFTITDTMSAGLDYVADSLALTIDGGSALSYTGTGSKYDLSVSGRTITITIPKATLEEYDAGDAIVVTYNATVNQSALTYDYEKNSAHLEYSSNPYDSTDKNTTPDSNVYVIDINVDVNKVAGSASGDTLTGATFKLYRVVGSTTEYYVWDTTNNKVTWTTTVGDADEFTTSDGSLTQQIRGLDQGTYYLLETAAPSGFNPLDEPVEFTITATEPTSGDNAGKVVYTSTNAAITNGVIDITAAQTEAQPVATPTIINNTGSILPSTGGIGTTMFYLIGSILVIGAGVILVTRRRVDGQQ